MSFTADAMPHLAVIKLHLADHLTYLRANQLLKQHDLTVQQALILQYLFRFSDQKTNQKDIERFMGISNPSVTNLMKTMVGKNLIRRLPDRSDARSYSLCLTEHSNALQPCIAQAFYQLSQEINPGLDENELQQLSMLLDKVTQNLMSVLD